MATIYQQLPTRRPRQQRFSLQRVEPHFGTTDSPDRTVVMGSACRCTSFQVPFSRRKMLDSAEPPRQHPFPQCWLCNARTRRCTQGKAFHTSIRFQTRGPRHLCRRMQHAPWRRQPASARGRKDRKDYQGLPHPDAMTTPTSSWPQHSTTVTAESITCALNLMIVIGRLLCVRVKALLETPAFCS